MQIQSKTYDVIQDRPKVKHVKTLDLSKINTFSPQNPYVANTTGKLYQPFKIAMNGARDYQ
jgi:hypothetical protein